MKRVRIFFSVNSAIQPFIPWKSRSRLLFKEVSPLIVLKNNYNADLIGRNIFRLTEVDPTNKNPTRVTTVSIPYVKSPSETISRILQPYNIREAHKPTTTLRIQQQTGSSLQDQMLRLPDLTTLVKLVETLTRD